MTVEDWEDTKYIIEKAISQKSWFFQYSLQDVVHYLIFICITLATARLANATQISQFLQSNFWWKESTVAFLMPLIWYFLKVFIQNNKK